MMPTIGRALHFYRWVGDKHRGPNHATVAAVNGDGTVNLGCLDSVGISFPKRGVQFVDAGGEAPQADYCVWPPKV